MRDMHCHILPGIDDGAQTMEESIEMLKTAEREGVTDIILTPHYMRTTEYSADNKRKKEIFEELIGEVKKNKIKVRLYLGNEIYISTHLLDLIKKGEVRPLSKSKYLLVEFPLNQLLINTRDILFELISNGYKIIVAHPERYKVFKQHPEYIEEYLAMGIIFQCNYKSLLGRYGYAAKKTIKYFLKRKYVTLLGSDIHSNCGYELDKVRKKLKSLRLTDEYINDLLDNNFMKVVEDKDFPVIRV